MNENLELITQMQTMLGAVLSACIHFDKSFVEEKEITYFYQDESFSDIFELTKKNLVKQTNKENDIVRYGINIVRKDLDEKETAVLGVRLFDVVSKKTQIKKV